ncbi:MAG: DsbA family oxidoreductase [Rhodocyclales bacterium]|nr:DsbA family oxidoreductase [Rhodocyclales bacterium]
MKMTVDVVSDVVCPWCFIGKRNLDAALQAWRAEQPGCEVTVQWRPFFLNPDTPESGEPYRPFLEKKFGGPKQLEELWQRVSEAGRRAGIEFAFEKIELRANTLNAHRLIHYAQTVGVDPAVTAALVEALFAAQFLEGRHVGDRAVLSAVAGECGMDAVAVRRYLDSDEDAEAVRSGADQARRRGVNGVPFFIFNDTLAASGAQPPEALLKVMRDASAA